MSNNSLIPVLTHKIPEFVREDYPNFVQYIRDYLEFLEQDENFLGILNDWRDNMEPSLKVEPYIDAILTDLGFVSGQNLAIDKHLLVHLLRDFYLSRGNEASFRFLFRMLFNADVEIRYPREQMFVPSYAEYGERHFIYTSASNIDSTNFQELVLYVRENGGTLVGVTSKVKAAIENIQIVHGSGTPYFRIEILRPNFEFIVGEPANITAGEFQITEFVKPVLSIQVTNPGNGYMPGDVIQVSGAKLNGYAYIESTEKGGVTSVVIDQGGTGYVVGDTIRARSTDDGFGFSARVTQVGTNGTITGTKVDNQGYSYEKLPELFTAKNSVLTPVSTIIGAIQNIKSENPFVDFNTVAFSIASSTGSGAVLQAKQVSRFETRDWTDRKGFVAENSTLIDSDRVHQFAYTIVSPISAKQYDNFVREYLHPAGYVRSSSYEIVSNLGLNITAEDLTIGGEEAIVYDHTLTVSFLSENEITSTELLGTDIDEEIVTHLNEPILID